MGLLKNGIWQEDTPGFFSTSSYMKHHGIPSTPINNWVTKDGSAGPTGNSGFKAESGRYHLYYSPGCPFAHRASIILKLKKLESHISSSICSPYMYGKDGWHFNKNDSSTGDHLFGFSHLHMVYSKGIPDYNGEVSVPLLWDKQNNVPVSKESSDIFKMLNSAFDDITGNRHDFVNVAAEEDQKEDLDSVLSWVLNDFAFGVYKIGLLAKTDEDYQKAYHRFFEQLDKLEEKLENRSKIENNQNKFLFGPKSRTIPTIADIYLFVVLIRFDVAWYFLYKANFKRVQDYKYIFEWLKNVYNFGGVKETVDFEAIKNLYYRNVLLNPSERVPLGPELPCLDL